MSKCCAVGLVFPVFCLGPCWNLPCGKGKGTNLPPNIAITKEKFKLG